MSCGIICLFCSSKLRGPRGYTLAFFERGLSSASPTCVLVVREMLIFFRCFLVESYIEHLSDMFVLIVSRFAVCCW